MPPISILVCKEDVSTTARFFWPAAAAGAPLVTLKGVRTRRGFPLLAAVTLAALVSYLAYRLATVVAAGPRLADRLMAAVLLVSELFVGAHVLGFLSHVRRATRDADAVRPPAFVRATAPPVAVLIASYNEAGEVLDETLAAVAALDYPSARVYLLDDSTRPECRGAADELARTYGVTLVRRENRTGYKAGAINEALERLSEPYVAVLDADQRPHASWLRDVVPLMEGDPALAFVQVPQVYVNLELPVARAARHQQAVFFEYICEAKSAANGMFCCGSNVVLRRQALLAIARDVDGRRHYFDETTVTEDFATSLRLHEHGWRTAFLNRTYVVGMGPETLAGYFTQQMRWASGTIEVGLRIVRRLLAAPRALRPAQWVEYLLAGSYYLVGLANLASMLAPVAFVAAGVRPLPAQSRAYLFLFIPYLLTGLDLFYRAMAQRGYSWRELWLASVLGFGAFWIYTRAALGALLGMKRAFGVTPKGVGGSIPWRDLRAELIALAATATTAVCGALSMAIAGPSVGMAVNTFWAGYHALQLSLLFLHFNRPAFPEPGVRLFVPARLGA